MEMQVRFVQSVSFESTKPIYIDLHMFSYIRLRFQKCIIDTLGIFKDFNGHLFYCLHVKNTESWSEVGNHLKYILIHNCFQVSSLRISPSEISSEKETDLGLFSVDYFRNLSSYVLT